MQLLLAKVLAWKRNVQSARRNTLPSMLNRSIAATPAPEKLASQSKFLTRQQSFFLKRMLPFICFAPLFQGEKQLNRWDFVKSFFLYLQAVIAQVMSWSAVAFLDDDARILFAAFIPVPSVRFGSLNIFVHPNSPH